MVATVVDVVDPNAPDPAVIARAAELLRAGELVAFPTETVYGLAAAALNAAAVARLFEVKGRPARNPLIVHVSQAADARPLVADWPAAADRLAERFWPGPLTLVLPKSPMVPDVVTGGGPTVALRVPANPIALALLRAARLPLAAPSANRSSRISPTRAEHVLRDLGGRIPLLLDGGPTQRGVESTVLDLASSRPRLLRPGPVLPRDIEQLVGPIARSHPTSAGGIETPLPSPGMLARHYAPRTPLECLAADRALERAESLCRAGRRVGALLFDAPERPLAELTVIRMPRDPGAYAAELFAALHALDQSSLDRIIVALPPETDEWLAVRDRLRRASVRSEP